MNGVKWGCQRKNIYEIMGSAKSNLPIEILI